MTVGPRTKRQPYGAPGVSPNPNSPTRFEKTSAQPPTAGVISPCAPALPPAT